MDFERFKKTQSRVLKLIENSYKKNRLVHAYLFEGAKGTLKLEAAYYLASVLLCTGSNKPCGECLECKRIHKGEHPRIYYIEPDNGTIKKEQVDELIHEFSRKGLEEGTRVYIIKDIEKATLSASNSLLKFIEESNEGVYGIFITENFSNLLPTIVSRSQVVSFSKVSETELINEYKKNNVDEETAKVLNVVTNDVNEGLDLLKEGKIIDIINLVKKCNEEIVNDGTPYVAFYKYGKSLMDDVSNKKYHQIFLDLLITITNDRIYHIIGQDDNITFINEINNIDITNMDFSKAFKQAEAIVPYKGILRYNVNLETMYMKMFIEVMK